MAPKSAYVKVNETIREFLEMTDNLDDIRLNRSLDMPVVDVARLSSIIVQRQRMLRDITFYSNKSKLELKQEHWKHRAENEVSNLDDLLEGCLLLQMTHAEAKRPEDSDGEEPQAQSLIEAFSAKSQKSLEPSWTPSTWVQWLPGLLLGTAFCYMFNLNKWIVCICLLIWIGCELVAQTAHARAAVNFSLDKMLSIAKGLPGYEFIANKISGLKKWKEEKAYECDEGCQRSSQCCEMMIQMVSQMGISG